MYVPATPAQSAAALAPGGIVLTATPLAESIVRPARAALKVHTAGLNVPQGHPATVTGTLRAGPRSLGLPGRVVLLQALGRHGWGAVARARTGRTGRFQLRYVPGRVGRERVQLRFAGDIYDLGAHRQLGQLNVYRPAGAWSSKANCVAQLESSGRWHIVDPPYSGGLQFTNETWMAAGGGRYSSTAAGATPEQQMQVFSEYEPSHPGAWPVTVPACS